MHWKPVRRIFGRRPLALVLAHARQIRNVLGRKSGRKHAARIAGLLAQGLIRGSFVPA